MRILIGLTAVLILAVAGLAAEVKTIYKVHRFNASEIGISCQNGADPTGRKVGDIVIISCGR